MSNELHQSTAEAHPYEVVDGIDETLIEAIWRDLDRQLPRKRVRCVVGEIAIGFQDARIKTFVPIFVYSRALERLRKELVEIASTDNYLLDEQS